MSRFTWVCFRSPNCSRSQQRRCPADCLALAVFVMKSRFQGWEDCRDGKKRVFPMPKKWLMWTLPANSLMASQGHARKRVTIGTRDGGWYWSQPNRAHQLTREGEGGTPRSPNPLLADRRQKDTAKYFCLHRTFRTGKDAARFLVRQIHFIGIK